MKKPAPNAVTHGKCIAAGFGCGVYRWRSAHWLNEHGNLTRLDDEAHLRALLVRLPQCG